MQMLRLHVQLFILTDYGPQHSLLQYIVPMSTTALTTTNLLPSSVPELMPTGLNWTTFAMHFQDAIETKGLWGYFDGTAICPVLPAAPTPEQELALTQWIKEHRSAKALLTHCISDLTLIHIHGKTCLKDRWNLISKEFSSKGAFSRVDCYTLCNTAPELQSVENLRNLV